MFKWFWLKVVSYVSAINRHFYLIWLSAFEIGLAVKTKIPFSGLAAAGGLTKLAVASSLLADEPSSGGGYGAPSGGYGEPSYHVAPEPEYHVVSSGYGHGHARWQIKKEDLGPCS